MTQTTIPELIERRADEQPDDTAYTFYDYESDPAGVAESIIFVAPRSLPITTSGKVRRKASADLYRSGRLSRVEGR